MAGTPLEAFVPSVASALVFTGCSNANQSNPVDEARWAVSCSYLPDGGPAKPVDPPGGEDILNVGETKVTLHLTAGDVEITMDRSATPCTISPLMFLAQQGQFDETRCHRFTDYDIFVLQCGDLTRVGKGGPGYTIPDGLSSHTTGLEKEGGVVIYPKGTVAMMNTGRSNTAGSQSFIVQGDNQLSPGYAVFGIVDEGRLAVVQRIAAQGADETNGTSLIAEAVISSVTLNQ